VRSTGNGTGLAADATRSAGDLHLTCKAVADGGGTSAATDTAAGRGRCCPPAGQGSEPLFLTRLAGKSASESSFDGELWLEGLGDLVLSRPLGTLVAWVDGRVGVRFIEGGWTFLEKVRSRPPGSLECLLSPSMLAQ